MEAYRICLVKYAGELAASGNPGRWNLRGQLVIYTAGSRALTCLENVVHRSGEGLNSYFQVVRIDVPDALPIEGANAGSNARRLAAGAPLCPLQPSGAAWYQRQAAAILRVPSFVIAHEHNYVLNTRHLDFARVRIAG